MVMLKMRKMIIHCEMKAKLNLPRKRIDAVDGTILAMIKVLQRISMEDSNI